MEKKILKFPTKISARCQKEKKFMYRRFFFYSDPLKKVLKKIIKGKEEKILGNQLLNEKFCHKNKFYQFGFCFNVAFYQYQVKLKAVAKFNLLLIINTHKLTSPRLRANTITVLYGTIRYQIRYRIATKQSKSMSPGINKGTEL